MKYTLFSVDDSRKHYKDKIRKNLSDWEEVPGLTVDGRDPVSLSEAQERFPYPINYLPEYGDPRLGHLGIWYGVLSALEHAPILTIEDDAIMAPDFHREFRNRIGWTPKPFDFFSLFIPRDSDYLFVPEKAENTWVTRTYQRYGGVSMFYTKQGAEKIKALLERDGITGQYDDTLYRYAKQGELDGYCSRPDRTDLVYITGAEKSIVQESDFV